WYGRMVIEQASRMPLHRFRKNPRFRHSILPKPLQVRQIYNVAQPFVSILSIIKLMILIGGVEVKTDMKKIEEQGANILISTPVEVLILCYSNSGC
ncbi:DEAD-box ATP-dependent RNA helicase 18-like, partial [Trifolium medium]|nr:DEAD-box ATP-dependent RNA helicase 18-like [Trifolium medium]